MYESPSFLFSLISLRDFLFMKTYEDICGIYKITSPTGKIYIGQSKKFEERFSDYRRGRCPQQRKLFNSFYKYGFINHTIEIIEICEIEDLDCQERYWQDFYDVKDREVGLNCVLTACGDKKEERFPSYKNEKLNKSKEKIEKKIDKRCRKLTEFERFKISVRRGKESEEEKQNLLDNFKEGDLESRLRKNGHHLYKEKRDKNIPLKRKIRHSVFPVLDTQSGVFYESLKEVCELYGLNYGTMKQRLNGRLKNKTPFIYT